MNRLHLHWMSLRVVCVCVALAGFAPGRAVAAEGAPKPAEPKKSPASAPDAKATEAKQTTEAERIIKLERALKNDRDELAKLEREQKKRVESELSKAKEEVATIDDSLAEKKKALAEHKQAGRAAEAETVATDIAALEKKRELAVNRVKLAVQAKKTLDTHVDTLGQKIKLNEKALAKLEGKPEPGAPTASAPTSQPVAAPMAPAPAQPAPPTAPKADPSPASPTAVDKGDEASTKKDEDAPTPEMLEQQEKVKATEAEAKEAEEEVKTLAQQIELLDKTIDGETARIERARQSVELFRKQRREYDGEYDRELAKPEGQRASEETLEKLRKQSREADKLAREAQADIRRLTEQLATHRAERAELERQRIEADRTAEEKKGLAQVQVKKLESLTNPYSVRNILQWFIIHGPKVALILLGMALAQFIVKLVSRHFVTLLARSSREETQEERENRAHTLVSVFRYVATVVIVIGGIATILQEVGVSLGPVLGGAAVLGLAVAFGAQNLVRDYFHGFVILLENQYGINDVVKIAGVGGLVERITLRVTVLRDIEGVVHFIPHGQISTVSNMTHGWSRALFKVGVAYKEDTDRVIDVIVELGAELRRDPAFGPHILEDLTMLGVDDMAESAVVIKFFIKTKQMQQWGIKREMLRRIKKKFDELDIEIPFPHRKIFHYHESGAPPQATGGE